MPQLDEIIAEFGFKVIGDRRFEVEGVTTSKDLKENGITWAKADKFVAMVDKGAVVLNEKLNFEPNPDVVYLITSKDAKLAMARLVQKYFTPPVDYYLVNEVDKHKQNPNIKIGESVFIGQNVTIGDGTVIMPQAVIEANTVIGKNCIVKSHVSIGSEGLGIVIDPETDLTVKLPQIGNVVMEDNVDIGPTTTVRRGTLGSTVIKEGAKIGSLINIGHNTYIGRNTILTCNMVISGSSVIEDYVYIGVNAVIRNGITIGKKTQIGMGAVVTKSIPENVIAYGNPAKVIRSNE